MRPVRVTFRGFRERGPDLLLHFAVELGGDDVREATVLVPRGGGLPRFPHSLDAGGESLGPVVDAVLAERAEQLVAILDLAIGWSAFRRGGRRR